MGLENRDFYSKDLVSQPQIDFGERLSQRERDIHFAMESNGYFSYQGRGWLFRSEAIEPLKKELKGQRVSFFGPSGFDQFYSGQTSAYLLEHSFRRDPVTDAIRKYREIDKEQAGRIAFLFGGIVRYLDGAYRSGDKADKIADSVEFAAKMTLLGEIRSADAIASAISMYLISGGPTENSNAFAGHVYQMSEAISEDPIDPMTTKDLGLSQVIRLRHFLNKLYENGHHPLPDISSHEEALNEFPTIGAEFHFPLETVVNYPNFWQRLAILNMSQYQRGSYIQLSRNDRDVIEVRMNPSIYPITIADWNYMKRLLPELNKAFFTMTINRKNEARNFSWDDEKDANLLNNLRALGMLLYAGRFQNVPLSRKKEEIDFGGIYLGQTVRLQQGKFLFSGSWSGDEGLYGQLSIYAGYGDNFPDLAYYFSMALSNPDLFSFVPKNFLKIRTLEDALALSKDQRKKFFAILQNRIMRNKRLGRATIAGANIIEELSS